MSLKAVCLAMVALPVTAGASVDVVSSLFDQSGAKQWSLFEPEFAEGRYILPISPMAETERDQKVVMLAGGTLLVVNECELEGGILRGLVDGDTEVEFAASCVDGHQLYSSIDVLQTYDLATAKSGQEFVRVKVFNEARDTTGYLHQATLLEVELSMAGFATARDEIAKRIHE